MDPETRIQVPAQLLTSWAILSESHFLSGTSYLLLNEAAVPGTLVDGESLLDVGRMSHMSPSLLLKFTDL